MASYRRLTKDAIPTIFPAFPKSMQPKPRSKVKRIELKRLPLAPANRPSKKMKTEHALKVFMADHSSYAAAESNVPAQLKEKEEKIVEIKRKLHLLQRRNKKLLEKVTSLESMVGKYKDVTVQAQTPDMDILKQAREALHYIGIEGAFFMGGKVLVRILISVGDQDLEDSLVFGPPGSGSIKSEVRIRIRILPFSHRGVERTIMLAK